MRRLARAVAALSLLALVVGCTAPEAPLPPRLVARLDASELAPTRRADTALVDFGTPEARRLYARGFGSDENAAGEIETGQDEASENESGATATGERSRGVSRGVTFVRGSGGPAALDFELVDPRPLPLALRAWRASDGGGGRLRLAVNGHGAGTLELVERTGRIELPASALRGGRNRIEWLAGDGTLAPEEIRFDRLRLGRSGEAPAAPRLVAGEWELPFHSGLEIWVEREAGEVLAVDGVRATGGARDGWLEIGQLGEGDERETVRRVRAGSGPLAVPLAAGADSARIATPLRLALRALPVGAGDEGGALRVVGARLLAPAARPVSSSVAGSPAPASKSAQSSAPAGAVRASLPTAPTSQPPTRDGARRPNILIYLVDTLRADRLGCYGYARPTTPAADRLAREAVLFERATAQSSWTRPATATILTGLDPRVHGAQGRRDRLPEGVETLAERLSRLGYATAGVVTNGNVSGHFGFRQGFAVYRYIEEKRKSRGFHQLSDRLNQEAFAWLDRRPAGRPFLLYLHASDPHSPYTPREDFRRRFAAEVRDPAIGSARRLRELAARPGPPDPREVTELSALYDAEVAFNDASFGALLDGLRARGLYDETVVVLLSDHGEEFAEHGGFEHGKTLYEEQLRVPLLVKLPRGAGGGRRVAGRVGQVDLVPTLLDLVGEPPPANLQGRSLRPELVGEELSPRAVFAALRYYGIHAVAVIERERKLLRDLRPAAGAAAQRLFDLARDPGERDDRTLELPFWLGLLEHRLGAFDLARPTGFAPVAAVLDPEMTARLKALGYLK